jgi:hypothetical protein
MKIHVRALICILGVSAPAWTFAAQQATVDARWQKHEINVTYVGFASSYSCVGLEDKFKVLWRLAGARPDGHVRVVCTSAVHCANSKRAIANSLMFSRGGFCRSLRRATSTVA